MFARFVCTLLVAFPVLAGAADTLVVTSRATGTLYLPGSPGFAYSLDFASELRPASVGRQSGDIVFSEYGPATFTLSYNGRTEVWSDAWDPGMGQTSGRMSPGNPILNTGDTFSHDFRFLLTRDNYGADGGISLSTPRGSFPGSLDFVPQAFTVTDPDRASLVINMLMGGERIAQWYGTVDSFSLSISPVPEARAVQVLPLGLAVLLIAGWRRRMPA
ncbi:hypothetical protein ACWV27_07625 [Massilia varians]